MTVAADDHDEAVFGNTMVAEEYGAGISTLEVVETFNMGFIICRQRMFQER